MSVISFVQPKGGTGKSTSALLLAVEAAKRASTIVIDGDPNAPMKNWKDRGGRAPSLDVWQPKRGQSMAELIEKAQELADFVVVDTEGTANQMAAEAVAASDLVIIPAQASTLDFDNAATAIKLVRKISREIGDTIPFTVLLTRVSAAIRTRGQAAIDEQLEQAGIPRLSTQLVDREAFRAMFAYSLTLEDMEKLKESVVSNVAPAWFNAKAFAGEVFRLLADLADQHNEEAA